MHKKGQTSGLTIGILATFATIFVTVVMSSTIGAKILEKVDSMSMFTANSVAKNLTTQGMQGLQTWADFYPIVGLVLIGSVIIALLVSFR